jgi:S1-C subfamily serine protease
MHGDDRTGWGAWISPHEPLERGLAGHRSPRQGFWEWAAAPSRARGLLIYLAVIVFAAAAGVGAVLSAPGTGSSRTSAPRTGQGHAAAAKPVKMNNEAVYESVEPGIVDVSANLQYLEETAEGTGFVIDASRGLVLTNNHVIDGATSVSVTPVKSGRSYQARVVGYDAADDVALLQLHNATGLSSVPLGNSSSITVGTQVLAIGNEAGKGGSPTLAPGTIGSLDRTIVASDQNSGLSETLYGMLQTNADIRPGDSGGPLANAAGQVIAMDTAAGGNPVYSGYAIPINQALSIAREIAAGHSGLRIQIGLPAFLGALLPSSTSSSPELQASQERKKAGSVASSGPGCTAGNTTGVPVDVAPARSGALVDGVLCGTPADMAGLSAGDVITALGGQAVTSPGALNAMVARYRPGSEATLAWVGADGKLHTGVITLNTGPAG